MTAYTSDIRSNRWWQSLYQIAVHVLLTLLAIGIAFSLPAAAQYILYQWWPRVVSDGNLLLASEIGLAASLVLLFNFWRITADNREKGRVADAASLVYARHRSGWLDRLRERGLFRRLPAARDAFVLTLTGQDIFSDNDSPFWSALERAYEIRVMLLNPSARGAEKRIDSLPREVTRQSYLQQVGASIDQLGALRRLGKKISLRFYEHEPFWKLVVLGDHLWVQYCHSGFEVKGEPEYVFALNPEQPRLGFFVPFYMYFLEQWGDPRHPQYDFDTDELVYCDDRGREVRRAPLGGAVGEQPALLQARPGPGIIQKGSGHENASLDAST